MISPFEYSEHILASNDVDTQKRMTAVALCNFMQNLAGKAAEKRGYGYSFMKMKGFVWVLIRLSIKVVKYPKWNDKIKLETWVKSIDSIKSDRHFILYDSEGNEIGYAITEWAMIDFKTRRPQLIDKFIDKSVALAPKSADVVLPAKLKEMMKQEKCGERKITYSDIDLNKHVSNVKYIEWFLDTYDYEFLELHTIKVLEVNFLSECRFEEVVNLYKNPYDNDIHYGSVVRLTDNKEVFRIKIEWN